MVLALALVLDMALGLVLAAMLPMALALPVQGPRIAQETIANTSGILDWAGLAALALLCLAHACGLR